MGARLPDLHADQRDPDLLEQAELVDLPEDGVVLEQLGLRALATIRPCSSTTIVSASEIVESR